MNLDKLGRRTATLAALLILASAGAGCTWFDDTPEQQARRRERRAKQAEERRRDQENPTGLSGLNATEMRALRQTIQPRKQSDVFTVRNRDTLGEYDQLDSLNEGDRAMLKKQREEERRRKKSNRQWVY